MVQFYVGQVRFFAFLCSLDFFQKQNPQKFCRGSLSSSSCADEPGAIRNVFSFKLPQSHPDVNVKELLALRRMCTIVFSRSVQIFIVFLNRNCFKETNCTPSSFSFCRAYFQQKLIFNTMIAITFFANQNFRLRVFLKLGYQKQNCSFYKGSHIFFFVEQNKKIKFSYFSSFLSLLTEWPNSPVLPLGSSAGVWWLRDVLRSRGFCSRC